ncbi:MAG: hypothetical protein QM667_08430 [Asticcacaulis sp.]
MNNTAVFIALFAVACGVFTMFISVFAANAAKKKNADKKSEE